MVYDAPFMVQKGLFCQRKRGPVSRWPPLGRRGKIHRASTAVLPSPMRIDWGVVMKTRSWVRALAAVIFLALSKPSAGQAGSAHDFTFRSIDGEPLPLDRYRGNALLVVNTASFCGFTRQYDELQSLWARYRDRGLVVLGVPSNDFGNQEPGSDAEIKTFCEVNFAVDFPLTSKEHVAGTEAHPFYRWAKDTLGPASAPRWNFHKYLVAPDGQIVRSFPTTTSPVSATVIGALEPYLAEAGN